nr:type II secretion system F family protein [Clostridium sp. E02]
MAKERKTHYSANELSAFCLQISILLHAAIPLEEGLAVMAEDAVWKEEKEVLLRMAEETEEGLLFSDVLTHTGVYPSYVTHMAKLGEQTGSLDEIMEALSRYYEKEHFLKKNIKQAITYPTMMIFMLLVILLVLFTKVMPIFEDVYEQLGAEMSPVSLVATRLGGIFSGISIVVFLVLFSVTLFLYGMGRKGKRFLWIESLTDWIKRRSKIAKTVANRRFVSVLSLTLKSGLPLEKGMELASGLVENQLVEGKIRTCAEEIEQGLDYYTAMKRTGLFKGVYVQMIKVGTRTGRLDMVMEEIAKSLEEETDAAVDRRIRRFEPTIVAVMAVAVGMILLSVMLPLMGVLSAIG